MKGYYDWIESNTDSISHINKFALINYWDESIGNFRGELTKTNHHVMLLSLDEAQSVIDDLCNSKVVGSGTTYAGNIKDSVSGAKKLSRLMSFKDAGKLIFRLQGLGIKAIQYTYQGRLYVKITDYPSLRRILSGTRYSINHPQVLELGIGRAGVHTGIISGAKFCIWFSACWRVVELIFKSEHDVAAFIGNITMDAAKVIVTVFVTKIFVVSGGWLVALAGVTVTLPVSVGIVVAVSVGFFITATLDYLDNNELHCSEKLIVSLRQAMKENDRIRRWNLDHATSLSPWSSHEFGY
ncbi:hypothetical protein QMG90_03520 [Trabulsiella odontotermitis]|uniref:hypothetical protein n=1 Tax=Trabulsiella odontotermitis TaxID=379893 RepID=UPI0024B75292|nr:hypothetical protein [Trabulsiella odontotermitis]WHP32023.1 hypothetical protein QMG90_03520 [Trabulsiella odontotermitis]